MQTNKFSPYNEFKEWLLNSYPKAILSEIVLRAINPKTVLHMFGKLGGITVFLDEQFNRFELMECDPQEFYSFLKELVQKHKIKKYDFSFFSSISKDEAINKLQKKLPHLKKYEIHNLLEYCQNDPNNDSFLENLGLKTIKTKKLKKKKTEKKASKKSSSFEDITNDIRTWNDWNNNFGGEN
jgi:hypothetical protein